MDPILHDELIKAAKEAMASVMVKRSKPRKTLVKAKQGGALLRYSPFSSWEGPKMDFAKQLHAEEAKDHWIEKKVPGIEPSEIREVIDKLTMVLVYNTDVKKNNPKPSKEEYMKVVDEILEPFIKKYAKKEEEKKEEAIPDVVPVVPDAVPEDLGIDKVIEKAVERAIEKAKEKPVEAKKRKAPKMTKMLFTSIIGTPREEWKKPLKAFFNEMAVKQFEELPAAFISDFNELTVLHDVASPDFAKSLIPFFGTYRIEFGRIKHPIESAAQLAQQAITLTKRPAKKRVTTKKTKPIKQLDLSKVQILKLTKRPAKPKMKTIRANPRVSRRKAP